MFMYSVIAVYTKKSVMNIVGVSSTEIAGNEAKDTIITEFRKGNIDNFVAILEKYGPNVYLNEVPYRMRNISAERKKIFKDKLSDFMKDAGTFDIASSSVIPMHFI